MCRAVGRLFRIPGFRPLFSFPFSVREASLSAALRSGNAVFFRHDRDCYIIRLINRREDIVNFFADGSGLCRAYGRTPPEFSAGGWSRAAQINGFCDLVGIHDDLPGRVPSGAPAGLDERLSDLREALLVRIEDCHEGDFRDIEPFPQEVDPDKDVKISQAAGPG